MEATGEMASVRSFSGVAVALARASGEGMRAWVGDTLLGSVIEDGKVKIMVLAQKLANGKILGIMPKVVFEQKMTEINEKLGTVEGGTVADKFKALAGIVQEGVTEAKAEEAVGEIATEVKGEESVEGAKQKLQSLGVTVTGEMISTGCI